AHATRAAARAAAARRPSVAARVRAVSLPGVAAVTVGLVAITAAGATTFDGAPAAAGGPTYQAAVAAFSARPVSNWILPTPAPTHSRLTAANLSPSADSMLEASIEAEKPVVPPPAKPAVKARSKAVTSRTLAQRRGATSAAKGSAAGWVCAISGCGGTFTSPFGSRWGTTHLGDDFSTPVGTPLHALNRATVTAAGMYGGMGNRVELDFGNGVSAVYAHMSSISVSPGQQLSAGQLIGLSGNTGHSTGPHLHLEIHLGSVPVDPAPWLRAHGIF
ncbi:MAG: M23 family metallopeptidase, partial [Actinomycetota bacterium]|nr:M23 family metallopeptidase [Actinomycetota bacterium]